MSVFRVNISTQVFPVVATTGTLSDNVWPTAAAVMEEECQRYFDRSGAHPKHWNDRIVVAQHMENLIHKLTHNRTGNTAGVLVDDIQEHEDVAASRTITLDPVTNVIWIDFGEFHVVALAVQADGQAYTRTNEKEILDSSGQPATIVANVNVVIRAELLPAT